MPDETELLEDNLTHLRTVLAVIDAGSITTASQTLGKAASAVARSVRSAETLLDAILFERRRDGVQATPAGHAVGVRIRRISQEIELAVRDLAQIAPGCRAHSRYAIESLLFSGRKLRLIADICDLRSIGAAAAAAGMSPSGGSMALARTEAVLGVMLFERTAYSAKPGAAARRLALCSRRIRAELRHLLSDLAALDGAVGGLVVIGTTQLGRAYTLPTAIAATVSRFPDVRVRAVDGSFRQLVTQLRAGEIDLLLGVLRPDVTGEGIQCERIFIDEMRILTSRGHPLANRATVALTDLLDEKWILPRSNSLGVKQVAAAFAAQGLRLPPPAVETSDVATLRQLLNADNMVAVASPLQMRFEIDSGMVVALPVALAGTMMEIGLMWRQGTLMPPAALAIVEAIRAHSQFAPP